MDISVSMWNENDAQIRFGMCGDDIQILDSPKEFYDSLLSHIKIAEREITICALYLGIGSMEAALVECLVKSCRLHPNLKVNILFDYSRGQRKNKWNNQGKETLSSSVDLFSPLQTEFANRVTLGVYKVPQLSGMKMLLPSPIDETVGVLHVKSYVFDDTLIMSGANLSHDYFTNRQDRYHVFNNTPSIANFYHQLGKVMLQHSFQFDANLNRTDPASETSTLAPMIKKLLLPSQSSESSSQDTYLYPTVQFTPLGLRQDEAAIVHVLKSVRSEGYVDVASGYLNFPVFFQNEILNSSFTCRFLTAAPQANGFYTAKGVKRAIPTAYSLIAQKFYQCITPNHDSHRSLFEYNRENWTFHAKGLWIGSQYGQLPNFTIIGSSNFGRRSFDRDFESQVYVATTNKNLQLALDYERTRLFQHVNQVSSNTFTHPSRTLRGFGYKQGYWIKPIAKLISSFL